MNSSVAISAELKRSAQPDWIGNQDVPLIHMVHAEIPLFHGLPSLQIRNFVDSVVGAESEGWYSAENETAAENKLFFFHPLSFVVQCQLQRILISLFPWLLRMLCLS